MKAKKAQIKFIGTGSGKTSLKRFHSSFIITVNNYLFLVDAGDGISKALLSAKIDFNSINAVLLTHMHPDHFSGLASLIVQMKIQNRKEVLEIYIHTSLENSIKKILLSSNIFADRLNFDLVYKSFNDDELMEVIDGVKFLPRQNTHMDTYQSSVNSKEQSLSCSSFLFTIGNKTLLYSGDVGGADDLYLFDGYDVDIILSEITHLNLDDLFDVFGKMKAEQLVLTHIGDEDENKLAQFKSFLKSATLQKIITAYDGLELSLA